MLSTHTTHPHPHTHTHIITLIYMCVDTYAHIQCVKSPVGLANIKLSIFWDWLFYKDKYEEQGLPFSAQKSSL
jgi:hypothetical protein